MKNAQRRFAKTPMCIYDFFKKIFVYEENHKMDLLEQLYAIDGIGTVVGDSLFYFFKLLFY